MAMYCNATVARKKLSTTIYIEPEQQERLKLLHERTKVPISVYIREGIDLVLAKYAHLLPGQASFLDQAAPGGPLAVVPVVAEVARKKPAER